MARLTKKDIYQSYGIEYDNNGHIKTNEFGFIPSLLIDGNTKLGKGVWTFSTLPTNRNYTVNVNGKEYVIKGTCPCHCDGCYATKGKYNFSSVQTGLAIKTWLARNDIGFVQRAIIAQIKADNIKLLRIHAAGDFFNQAYIEMWKNVVKACQDCVFWTYTKNADAENAFNEFENINVVKSVIPGIGFNFGKCAYIIKTYNALKAAGKTVYICRCGIDKNQHCSNCKGCSRNEHVLFIEHSTGYNAETDPYFAELKSIIDAQGNAFQN